MHLRSGISYHFLSSRAYLRGSTLMYTLLIALLISTILTSYLIINSLQQTRANQFYATELAQDNLQSGTELWLSESIHWDDRIERVLFESSIDSFQGISEKWGLFGLIHACGTHSNNKIHRSCLVGEEIPQDRTYSFYLEDRRQPLVVVGKTSLTGKLFLPPSGIRSGFIGRRGFEGKQLYRGTVVNSQRNLPSFSLGRHPEVRKYLQEIAQIPPEDQVFALQNIQHFRPWEEVPYEVISPGSIVITQSQLAGKCRIVAAGNLTVKADSKLDNCILFARDIEIEAGFKGRLQAFATESIHVHSQVQLQYPSVLMVNRSTEMGQLTIDEQATVEGAVILDLSWFRPDAHRNDLLAIAPHTLVKGIVYAAHNLEIQGIVQGQVIAGSLVLRTAGGMYRNHLLDANINLSPLAQTFSGPLVYGSRQFRIVEWL